MIQTGQLASCQVIGNGLECSVLAPIWHTN